MEFNSELNSKKGMKRRSYRLINDCAAQHKYADRRLNIWQVIQLLLNIGANSQKKSDLCGKNSLVWQAVKEC